MAGADTRHAEPGQTAAGPGQTRPAPLTRLRVGEGRLSAASAWDEILDWLGLPAGETLRLRAGSARIGLDPVSGAAPLTGAAARALDALGAWVRVRRPAGQGDARELLLEPALPRELPPELGAYGPLVGRLAQGAAVRQETSELAEEALAVWNRPGFETFVSLPRLRFEPFPHQWGAAKTVLGRLRGRAILADEVGLGKTIEAGLVLAELYLRRLVERTLILVPAGLVEQWREELDRKFALPCLPQGSEAWRAASDPWAASIVVASLAAVRRAPLREQAVAVPWDLVIVDEAHRLKNPQSASARLVKSLHTRHLLLLTATPVENRLDDLFQLVNLVRPGQLGTPKEFRRRHGPAVDAAAVRDLPLLQAGLREVMVRHRRSEVALQLPRRLAETVRVLAGDEEAEIYGQVSARVRADARGAAPSRLLALRTLQRLAGSSPRALAPSLAKAGWNDLAARAASIPSTPKSRRLLDLVGRHVARGEKLVVFTAFRQTLAFLADSVAAEGLPAALYHGGLSRREKDQAVRRFEEEVPLLLTTEAAGEGRNLQFCHVMVNFDLPWNPMQIEQRLGRIHRIGQDHDVLLTNLVTRGTVEERILQVLEAKINLFELVVGELDMILGRVEEDFDFESFVFDTYVESGDDAEFGARLEAFGEELAQARRAYLEERGRVDSLVAGGLPA